MISVSVVSVCVVFWALRASISVEDGCIRIHMAYRKLGLYNLDNSLGTLVSNQRLKWLQKYSLYATVDLDCDKIVYLGMTALREYDSSFPNSINHSD